MPFRRIYSKVAVVGGDLIQPEDATKEYLEEKVRELRSDKK